MTGESRRSSTEQRGPHMSRLGRTFALLALSLTAWVPRARGEDLARHPGESVSSYGKRVLPRGMELAAKPVALSLGGLGKVIVILFRPEGDTFNYSGWLLAPASPDSLSYRKLRLPRSDAGQGRVGIEVKSIFSADVDADGEPDLCVLSHEYEYGTGDAPYFATDCYHRTGDRLELIEALAPLSIGLKNAKAVRAHFAKHPVTPGAGLPHSPGAPPEAE
jgi:hypothetical protein